jgi:hypothetical protein
MSSVELIELADGLVAMHHIGEHVDDRHVLSTVNLLLAYGAGGNKNARLRRVGKLIRTFDLKIARV